MVARTFTESAHNFFLRSSVSFEVPTWSTCFLAAATLVVSLRRSFSMFSQVVMYNLSAFWYDAEPALANELLEAESNAPPNAPPPDAGRSVLAACRLSVLRDAGAGRPEPLASSNALIVKASYYLGTRHTIKLPSKLPI